MAFPQDALGRYVVFPFSQGQSYTPSPQELSHNGLLQKCNDITAQVFTYGPTSPHPGAPSQFHRTTRVWTFRWLEYVPGATTTCKLQAPGPVMTGPMSGCMLATYTDGGPRVAHVGTGDPGSKLTNDAKAAWTNYLANSRTNQTTARGGYPNRVIGDHEVEREYKPGLYPLRCGYFESVTNAWAIMFVPVPESMRPPVPKQTFLVRTITPMPMSPWPQLRSAF